MIHNYTSNVSHEQFELIREDLANARKGRVHVQLIYMRYSAAYYTCLPQVANGAIYQVTSQTGKLFISTIRFGGK